MKIDRASLEQRFAGMSDGELLERLEGDMTDRAREVASAEATRRGLQSNRPDSGPDAEAADPAIPALGPMKVCARYLNPLNAQVLAVCLESAGIDAHVMDSDTVYANGALFGALSMGGVRVMVPESQLDEALRIRAAFDAGEMAIDEDFDVGK